MCDYCKPEYFARGFTPERRMEKRIEKFIVELRKHRSEKWMNWNIAEILESFLTCEDEFAERMTQVMSEMKEMRTEANIDGVQAVQ